MYFYLRKFRVMSKFKKSFNELKASLFKKRDDFAGADESKRELGKIDESCRLYDFAKDGLDEKVLDEDVLDEKVLREEVLGEESLGQEVLSEEILDEEERKDLARRKKKREEEHNFIASLPGVSEILLVNKEATVLLEEREDFAMTEWNDFSTDGDFTGKESNSDCLQEADYGHAKIVIPKDVDREVIKERIKKFLEEQENKVAKDEGKTEEQTEEQDGNLAYLGKTLVMNLLDSDIDKSKYQSLSAEATEELIEALLREDKLERQSANESAKNVVVETKDSGREERLSQDVNREDNQDESKGDYPLEEKKALHEMSEENKSKQWREKALGEELKNRPWTLFYDPLLKSTYEYKDESAYAMLERALSKYPDDIALVDAFAKKTNQQVLNDIYLAASALRDLGVGPGKVVTLCLANCIQFVTVFYAVQRLQAIAHVVHPLTPAKRLVKSMRSVNSYVLFTSDTAYKNQVDELRMIPLHYVIVCSIYDNFDQKFKNTFRLLQMASPKLSFSWRKLKDSQQKLASHISQVSTYSLNKNFQSNRSEVNENISLLSQFIESYPTKEYKKSLDPMHSAVNSMTWKQFISLRSVSPLPRIRENDVYVADRTAVYLNSGGTMDEPKTIVLTSRNINTIAVQAPGIFGRQNMRGLKLMALLPFFHSYGLCMELHATLTNNMTCILLPKYSARNYARLLIKEQADILIGVPTFYEALQNNPYLKGQNLSFIKAAFCGGDHLKSALKKKIDEYFLDHHAMISLREGYGLSEASSLAAITPAFGNRLRSVGLPIADLDVLIANAKTGEIIENSEVGEILLSGPSISPGYLNDPEMNKKAFVNKDGKRYLKTGDLGFFDEDGFLYYVSRKKRIIKVSGISVYPFEVEQIIREVSGVEDVICVAGADKYKMSIVKAYIIPSELKDKISKLMNLDQAIYEKSELELEKMANEFVEQFDKLQQREGTESFEKPASENKDLDSEGEENVEENDNVELEGKEEASETKSKSVERFSIFSQGRKSVQNTVFSPNNENVENDEEIMEDFEKLSNRIRAHCKDNLIKHAVPEQIIYVESFPYTAIGKIDIAELEKKFTSSRKN